MLIYAGIDEAGYGPLLGPLCVSCCAFQIDHDESKQTVPDLWKVLKRAVCRKRTDRKHRIAIDDSKNLKGPNDGNVHPLKHLERGVMTVLNAMGISPACDEELFEHLNVNISPLPWNKHITPLPTAQTQSEIRIASNRLKRACDEYGIRDCSLTCQAIDADAFNEQIERMGNKANVNFCSAMRSVDTLWRHYESHTLRLVIDRHGGRTHYLQPLLDMFPESEIKVVEESESRSRYRLTRNRSTLELLFQVNAESHHLPAALASMTAKYVRELLMIRLNTYFRSHLPELKPTAGYRKDARRYLREIQSTVTRLGIDRKKLVRSV